MAKSGGDKRNSKKTCRFCGKVFEGAHNAKMCDECRNRKCPVCGCDVEVTEKNIRTFKKNGWVVCDKKECRSAMRRSRKAIVCRKCGNEFSGSANSMYCEECRTATCPVCGKKRLLSGPQLTRYLETGVLTCGDSKCRVELTRRNLIEREGVSNVSQRDDVREKLRQTRYRDSDETKARRAAAISESGSRPEVVEQRKSTMLDRYGYENPLQDPEIHAKAVEAAKSDASKEKRRGTLLERYGVSNAYLLHRPDEGPSSNELRFASALDEIGAEYSREFPLDGRFFDFKVGDVLVEINPWPWHNSTWHPYDRTLSLDCCKPEYHSNKSAIAAIHGMRCVHVFDWDDYEKVAGMFAPKSRANAADMKLMVVDGQPSNIVEFLDGNHLQGSCRGVDVSVYLYSDESGIASVMTFGKPRYNGNFDWELLRYCNRRDLIVDCGARTLLGRFRELFGGQTLLSYCDNAKFDGGVYRRLGFTSPDWVDGKVGPGTLKMRPSRHWYHPDTGKHFTDAYVSKRGVDQLLRTGYGKGADNRGLMRLNGFVEVWDCGQSRWELGL